jgi:hypothetical protein
MKRLLIAAAIVAGIYGIAVGAGSLLYVTGAIATGATHNDCEGIREDLAKARGIGEDDVPDEDVSATTAACLDEHQLTKAEAFRTEYLLWSLWPAVICGAIFLLWPRWSRILHRQDAAELAAEASRLEMGQ